MDVEFALHGIGQNGWFPALRDTIQIANSDTEILVSRILSPPGSFAASRIELVKASFASVVGLATITGGCVAVYSALEPRPSACEFLVHTDSITTRLTFDGDPVELTKAVADLAEKSLSDHFEAHGTPTRVSIHPIEN
jgi:hypothetical protein